jgi:hypothetical protein
MVPGLEQRQVTPSGAGLNRRLEQPAADALNLPADPDRPGIEVDVIPAQAKRFAAPQTIEHQQDERGELLLAAWACCARVKGGG